MLFSSTPGSLSGVLEAGVFRRPCRASENPYMGTLLATSLLYCYMHLSQENQVGKYTKVILGRADSPASSLVPEADSGTGKLLRKSHFGSLSFFLKSAPYNRSHSRRKSPLPWGSYRLIGYRRKDRPMRRTAAELGRSQLPTPEPFCQAVLFPPRVALLPALLPVCHHRYLCHCGYVSPPASVQQVVLPPTAV